MRNAYEKTFRQAVLGLAATAVLGLAAPALAGEEPGVKPPANTLLNAVDARGKLRQPTPAEAKELIQGVAALTKSAEGLPVTHWPDGMMSVDLGGAFMHVWVAYAGAGGSLRNACIEGPEAAAALLAPVPAGEEK
ncbi:MAG TPA: hypothetical protein VF789_27400 [Thermoanaerobaculia bacterium]